ncbi:MAG: MotA/TolQ/ExbB proton channel family protein [Pseudomonadales bacterium]|nr:MotA/TolQ/ExbB proton channel family protein [Pseudomonadales bacterium]MCP5184901.1 MotA/TolQ/ExbB proton channel family protein [Pseudomonadales bacterium]
MMTKKLFFAAGLAFLAQFANAEEAAVPAATADDLKVVQQSSLDGLLEAVRQAKVVESKEHTAREAQFRRDKDQQARMLGEAKAQRTAQERRSEQLETTFEENETKIGDLQEALDKRLGSLRELFGVLQQVAGDTRGQFGGSIISNQFPGRGDWLGELAKKMGKSTQLASIDEMERLWFELQREMTESGRVVKYSTTIQQLDGEKREAEVVRVGSFVIAGEDGFLQYDPASGSLVELARQPSARYSNTTSDLLDASTGEIVEMGIDPTRGSLLALMVDRDTWGDRIGSFMGGISKGECYLPWCDGQGEYVGAVIIIVGILGVLLAIERWISLTMIGSKVNAQKKSSTPNSDNPLGRVLKVYEENRDVDVETLELKLGEAILGENPGLTKNINLVQVISIVAPLLGLLGTVTGMILTFQQITLFGTGDPKVMAGGISQALVTTVEGLVVAIPTTLLYAIIAAKSRSIVHVLEEQSAGIIADHAERSGQPLG